MYNQTCILNINNYSTKTKLIHNSHNGMITKINMNHNVFQV